MEPELTKKELALALGMGEAQMGGLLLIASRTPARYVANFAACEGLRKRGLVTRSTNFVVGAEYADVNGVHRQWKASSPKPQHDWYVTVVGRVMVDFIRGQVG